MNWGENEPMPVKIAKLRIASPDFVYSELKSIYEHFLIEKVSAYSFNHEELERTLLERNEPFILMALAKYATTRKIIHEVFKKATKGTGDAQLDKGLRVAILANQFCFRWEFGPKSIEDMDLRQIATNEDSDEIRAMFQNPSAGHMLSLLYQKKSPFDELSSDKLQTLVYASIPNNRVNIDESDRHGPDFNYMGINKGIVQLLKTAPVEEHWMGTLQYLLHQLDPRSRTIYSDNVMNVLDRWAPLKVIDKFPTDKNAPESEELGLYTGLTAAAEFRCLVAALYGNDFTNGKSTIIGSKDDSDIALRCSYYGNSDIKSSEMTEFYKRDNDAFVFAALFNDRIFSNKKSLEKLDEMVGGPLQRIYEKRWEQISERKSGLYKRPNHGTDQRLINIDAEHHKLGFDSKILERIESTSTEIWTKINRYRNEGLWIGAIIILLLLRH
jgi:hypothetical protein